MFDKKAIVRTISMSMATAVLIGTVLLSGCTTVKDVPPPPAVEENKQDKTMPEFLALVGQNSKPDVLIAFIDKNISAVSAEDASAMLEELEKVQKNYLPKLEEKYYSDNAVQEGLSDIYRAGFDMSKIYDTKDPELKALLDETRAMGYKLETAEGMFFPIMDYEFMKKYSAYAAEDIKAYINIMAVETNKVPAKDAALVISWDEVVERALNQESFINEYGSSSKLEEVKKLQDKYITFMLYGLNNTPLFSYEAKTMDPEAKTAYEKAVKADGNSRLMQMLGKYMELLEKSDYKLSDEVEKFRKDAGGSY